MRLFQFVATTLLCGILSTGWARTDSKAVPLFEAGAGVRNATLRINKSAVNQLRSDSAAVSLSSVPLITGETANFTLTPMPLFAADAIIQTIDDNGTTRAVPTPDIRTWYGTDPRNPSRALFLAANDAGKVQMMITGDEQTSLTVISQDAARGADSYRIIPANLPDTAFCSIRETGVVIPAEAESQSGEAQANSKRTNVVYEIEMMIDVGYRLYNHLDSDEGNVMNYLTDLFGAVSTIYKRDLNTRMRLTYVTVWTTPDPFTRLASGDLNSTTPITTYDQLDNYVPYIKRYRYEARRDLAHFIDYNPLGGLAYVDILSPYTRDFRAGVSNVDAAGEFPEDINQYLWDTMVVSHEIGHNVGSPHSHCYTPPIDCCYRDCPQCTVVKPTSGTIMSYCHLLFGKGGTILMNFHPRTIALMRPKIENSLLLTPYADEPEIEIRGIGNVLAPNGATLAGDAATLKSPSLGGAPVVKTFTIKNIGAINLVLTGNPAISIEGSSNLTITQPAQTTVVHGGSTTFDVTYDPKVAEDQNAILTILNNDPINPEYKIKIKGRLMQVSNPYNFPWDGNQVIEEAKYKWTEIPIRVRDVPGVITDVNFSFNGTDCNDPAKTGLEHSYIGDLEIQLKSPEGTTMSLVNHIGASTETLPAGLHAANMCHTIFDDDDSSAPLIQEALEENAPFTGTWQPNDPLSVFDGEEANGFWTIRLYDWAYPDQGTLHSFTLTITGEVGESDANKAENWNLFN